MKTHPLLVLLNRALALELRSFFLWKAFSFFFSVYVCEREDTLKKKKNPEEEKKNPLNPFMSFLNSLALLLCGVLPQSLSSLGKSLQMLLPSRKPPLLLGAARSLPPLRESLLEGYGRRRMQLTSTRKTLCGHMGLDA